MDSSPTSRSRTMELPEMGTVLQERYRLEQVVGKGGMGVVVRAYHLQLQRPVAIKLMHRHLAENEDFVGRFKREMLIAKQIEHPNTVRIYDSGITDSGAMYLVMECLDGVELKELIAQGPMSFADVQDLGQQILDGLAEAHAINVVHRDLKPGNVFVCKSRRGQRVAKVLDFGIAKSLESSNQALTATGTMFGTGPYLAPELFLEAGFTKPADVYACGLMFFEMLAGRRLVDTSSIVQTMSRHLHMPLVLPAPLVGHPLGAVIQRALAKSVDARFSDAEAMLGALRQCGDACDQTRLSQQDIDAAFEQMQAAFLKSATSRMPDIPVKSSDALTMALEASDVELLDSASLSVPLTPSASTSAMTSQVNVNPPPRPLPNPRYAEPSESDEPLIPKSRALNSPSTEIPVEQVIRFPNIGRRRVFIAAVALISLLFVGVIGGALFRSNGEENTTPDSVERGEGAKLGESTPNKDSNERLSGAALKDENAAGILRRASTPDAAYVKDVEKPAPQKPVETVGPREPAVKADHLEVRRTTNAKTEPSEVQEKNDAKSHPPAKRRPKPIKKKKPAKNEPSKDPFEDVLRRHL